MKKKIQITYLFLAVGSILLTNGWNHHARKRTAVKYKLKFADMEERHRMLFEVYEKGKFFLEEYLNQVVFNQKRPFKRGQFWRFMCAQLKPYKEMIELIYRLKMKYGLRIAR